VALVALTIVGLEMYLILIGSLLFLVDFWPFFGCSCWATYCSLKLLIFFDSGRKYGSKRERKQLVLVVVCVDIALLL
jgi:ATP adenylyltransferase/5',5'''-P-1,P-4-tetraphosphate phosphorylase II